MSDAKPERGVMSIERPRPTPPESFLDELLDVEGLARKLLEKRGHPVPERLTGSPPAHPSSLSRP